MYHYYDLRFSFFKQKKTKQQETFFSSLFSKSFINLSNKIAENYNRVSMSLNPLPRSL